MTEEIEINSEKSFNIELPTDKNNLYSLKFNLDNYIEITANQINDIIHKSYSNKYSFEEIKDDEYFFKYQSLDEIFEEIKDRIYNNKIILKENGNNLIINIPLLNNKEMVFELKSNIKNNNGNYNEIIDLIIELKSEINNVKMKIFKLKQKLPI